jgi:hypothetical protein
LTLDIAADQSTSSSTNSTTVTCLAQHRQRIDDGVVARHRRCRFQPANAVGSARQEDVSCLDRILIAWKDTTEAVSVALPLLKRTKDVTIVEIVAEGNDALFDLGQTANAALRLAF